MKKVIIDASVFLKLIIDEEDTKLARKLIKQIHEEEYQIILPRLFEYEIAKAGIILGLNVSFIFEILTDFLNTGVILKDLDSKLLETASKIVAKGSVKSGFPSFYQAIYHSIAINEKATFITADKKYFTKAESFKHILLLNEGLLK
jgi:predicted nucleic acid-binding protein